MANVFIGLGSNLGDKEKYLKTALNKLSELNDLTVIKLSSFYETEPWGYLEQDLFLNAVVQAETSIEPVELLNKLQEIESVLGRTRTVKWGPRTIDLDILLYDQQVINNDQLIIPHPRMEEREFVLAPLAEIAPDFKLPDGRTPTQLLSNFRYNK